MVRYPLSPLDTGYRANAVHTPARGGSLSRRSSSEWCHMLFYRAPVGAPPEAPSDTPSDTPAKSAKSRWSIVIHAEWQGAAPSFGRNGQGSNEEQAPDSPTPCAKHDAHPGPRRRRALRSCALLAAIAFALLIASDLVVARFPTRVRVSSDGQALSVSIGGTMRAVALAHPLQAVRFVPIEPHRREYPIDGSDATNNATFNPEYIAGISDSPYYRFQSWLRDASGYSAWRNLSIRDIGEHPFIAQAQPIEDTAQGVPPGFELAVDLRRVEVPRIIEFLDDTGGVVRVEINRNDKYARVVRVTPEVPEAQLARWYFSREWLPEFAGLLYLILRTCAIALLLALLLVPIAMLLPTRVPLPTRRLTRALILGAALVVALAGSAYTSVALFDMSPYIFDAQAYYFQAKLFAAGMLYAPTPPSQQAFDVPFTVFHEGKWFSMYTPGAALVLALGVKLGAAWLVGPLLVVGGLLLTHAAARRQFGARTALLAAILMASSPFLHLQAASFMSHVPGMFWGAALLYAAVRYSERRALVWAVAAAAALGFLFLTREMSAILYATTIGGYVAWRTGVAAWHSPDERRRIAGDIAGVVACLLLFAGAYMLYNRALTGSALLLPRVVFSPEDNRYGFGEGVGFYGRHTLGGGLVNADEMLTSLAITLFGWPFYIALSAMALPFVLRRARAWDWVHGALAVSFVLAYIGLYYHGITFGPRYYLDALPALVLLAARGFVALAETVAALCQDWGRGRAGKRAELAALLLVAALLACNAAYFWPQQPRLYQALSSRPGTSGVMLGDFIERRAAGRVATVPNALIITRDRGLMTILGPLNCPRLDCDTIFAFSPNDETDGPLRAAFPARDWYQVRDESGVLTLFTIGANGSPPTR